MLVWILLMIIIALSLLSGEFARITEEFLVDHAITILLSALGILYWYYIYTKRNDD